jgi:hypothetical protein
MELETSMAYDRPTDEVMRRARVDQRRELVATDADIDLHRILRADVRDGREGDQRVIRVELGLLRGLDLGGRGHVSVVVRLLDGIVGRLEVEESRALVATDIWSSQL